MRRGKVGFGASVLVLAMVPGLTVACNVLPPQRSTPSPSASLSGRALVTIPDGAVPWANLPYQPYLPTPVPTPRTVPAPPCRLQDLLEQPLQTGGATGNEAVTFDFINRTSHTCLAGGYPHVVVSQPGHRAVVATRGGFFDQQIPPADLLPGGHAQFDIGFSYACLTGPASPLYQHVTVTLSSGGTFSQTLSGGQPPNSQIPAGIQVGCGVDVTELYVPPPQVTYPTDPMAGLTAYLQLPSSVHIGQTLVYGVSMVNPTASSIALNPCRGYYQLLDGIKSASSFYQLNCGAAAPIPGNGSESLVMNMPSYDVKPGTHSLCWTLDTGVALGPRACGNINFSP